MTAEIAILNRNAVALAADSAVTLELRPGPKVYETRKLFTLSKYDPVGVMIYGNADFMEVPWETIIKSYRARLGTARFATLPEYGDNFLTFVRSERRFFPSAAQSMSSYDFARRWLRSLKAHLRRLVREILKTREIEEREVIGWFRQIVQADTADIMRHKKLPQFSRVRSSTLLTKYRSSFRRAISDELQNLRHAVRSRELEEACAEAICRESHWFTESGVVIAGFGTRDFFPRLRAYTLDRIIDNKLRVLEDGERSSDIRNSGSTAAVVAFAQGDMVSLFMNGIDTEFLDFAISSVNQVVVEGYPDLLYDLVRGISPRRRAMIRRKTKAIGERAMQLIGGALGNYARKIHWQPIVDIVDHLPKEELAEMAEALVNLTSFKRHVTHQAETVGGPIDVAIISRGDGFVCIKRKHYFKPELNPQFTANYFREANSGRK